MCVVKAYSFLKCFEAIYEYYKQTDSLFYLNQNVTPDEAVVYITKDHNLNKPVTTIFAEDDDLDIDDDYIRWNITDDTKLIPWDYPNVTRTDRLFYIDGRKFCFVCLICIDLYEHYINLEEEIQTNFNKNLFTN